MAEYFTGSDHTVYSVQRVYNLHSGVIQQPVAGKIDGTQECAHVRVHSPMEAMAIVWTAEAEGKAPTLPDPKSFAANPNVVFLYQTLGNMVPGPLPSGRGHGWAVSGTFFYGLKRPRAPMTAKDGPLSAPIPSGRMPFEKGSADGFAIPPAAYSPSILGGAV